jgi:phosphatidate cytidylyltransferase
MAAGELAKRVTVAAVGIPLIVVLIYLGGWALGIVLAAVAAIGAAEVYALATLRGVQAFRPLGSAAAAGFIAFAAGHRSLMDAAPWLWWTALGTVVIAVVASLRLRGIDRDPLGASAVTVFGAVYVGGTLSFVVFLRNLDPAAGASWFGAALVAYPLAVTWVGDTAAYFCGTRWGRHRLSPRISPKKSVEGAVAGFAGSILAAALFGWLVFGVWLDTGVSIAATTIGAILISPAGQIGDLAESLLKRQAGVKDSGRLLPGHGGVLDRFDALFLAIPIAYVYLTAILPVWSEVPWR